MNTCKDCHEAPENCRCTDRVHPLLTFQDLIDKTHPMEPGAGNAELAADTLAMKLVGERHEKRDLVDLVRWLILRKPDGLLHVR